MTGTRSMSYQGVQTCLFSKPLEFEGVKIGVMKSLPQPKIFNGIAITHPVCNHAIRVYAILLLDNVCDADIVNAIDGHRFDADILDNYFVLLCHIRSIVLLSVPCRSLVIRNCKDTKKVWNK